VNSGKTGFTIRLGVVQFSGDWDFHRGIDMSSVTVELELPQDWKRFQMPAALQARLSSLLDEQDKTGTLTKAEREEAQALTELVDMLSLMKLRAERAGRSNQ
jgi:hypothetical protein